MRERVADLGRRVLDGELLGRSDALVLAESARTHPHELMYWASLVREQQFGREVRLCSIVAGKLGGCSEDCKWCAQSARSAGGDVSVSRCSRGEVLTAAREAARLGAACIGIVNSGRGPAPRDIRDVTTAVEAVSADAECPLEVCASLGVLTDEQASDLASAGVKRYNHNLETSRRRFAEMVTTHAYDDRLETLAAARRAGMELCCGGIFGLGETWADRIDLALTLRDEVRPRVVPLNFLHPIPGTALANQPALAPMEVLSIIAVFRLLLPGVDLKVAGGRERNLRELQSWIFHAGASSTMIGNYLTTAGRNPADDLRMIADLGLTVAAEVSPVRPPEGALDAR